MDSVGPGRDPGAPRASVSAEHRLGKRFPGWTVDWRNELEHRRCRHDANEHRRKSRVAAAGPNVWGEDPIVSPDGRMIAYAWYPENSAGETLNQLGLVANEPNARPRVLLDKPEQYQNIYPLGWSRDGKSLLIRFEILPSRNSQMAWISIDDGTLRVIHEIERGRNRGENSLGFRLSPDGKFLLYSARTNQETDETAIYILPSDGGTAVELIRSGINESPVWTSDGGRVLFISDQRSGHFDLWSVPVRDGKRTGAASIAKEDIGRVKAYGISPAGTYLYGFNGGLHQVLVAEMDRSGAQARDAAKPIEGFVGHSPRWSRDGKWIAFKQRITTFDKQHLIIHSMETGAKWTIRPNTLAWGVPQWFLDGSVQPAGAQSSLRVSVSSGEPKEFTAPRAVPLAGALSPDDNRIYVLAREGQTSGINVIDTATGERREFLKMPVGFRTGWRPIALSPDGGTLAIRTTNGIARMGVDGADFREILTMDSEDEILDWTRDGRYILFPQRNGTGSRIMRVPAGGGQPEFTGIATNDPIQQFDLSPDGSRLAYAVNSNRWEDWALENVTSAWSGR